MRSFLFGLVSLIFISAEAQNEDARMYIFGHSLIDHRPPLILTPSDETTVPHWVFLLAEADGNNFYAGGQYGFLPQHSNLPPFSQWGYDLVPGVWESDLESFAEADINLAMITAGNFIQYQGPSAPYEDPNNVDLLSPVSATEKIIDWLESNTDGSRIYIYENWPDMAAALGDNVYPPSQGEMKVYWNTTNLEFHNWWLEYQDVLLSSRPQSNVRMIPVGPVLGKVYGEFLKEMPSTELFEDDAPHGRANIYFLAGLATYMAIYEKKAPSEFEIPPIINEEIRMNYDSIVSSIWTYLFEFDDEEGNSRVFTNSPSSVEKEDNKSFRIYPNPASEFIIIEMEEESGNIQILDREGRVLIETNFQPNMPLDIGQLPRGLYFASYTTKSGFTRSSKFIKM